MRRVRCPARYKETFSGSDSVAEKVGGHLFSEPKGDENARPDRESDNEAVKVFGSSNACLEHLRWAVVAILATRNGTMHERAT